ncbi:ANTAR domain-containing protein [Kribbella sp. NPDC000426]|uniref:ANTAR domain-containing protein n=1 Tax=Kribbella sp. NPDC000426 TaxID=3154255 RepID=UPI0033194602
MERYGLDAVRAFAALQRHSQTNNQRLRAVALHVIETGNLPQSQPPPTPERPNT